MIAVAGATGYIGGLLCKRLREEGLEVRALARHPERAKDLKDAGCEVVRADVLEPETLGPALQGADVAYYLVHSMGRGSDGDFAARDHQGAENFAAAAAAAGVKRVVYLGGLGEGSEAPQQPPPDRGSPAPGRGPGRLLPRRRRARRRQRVLPHRLLPGTAPAGDDRRRAGS